MHSRKERRYICTTRGRTFDETRETPLYRLKATAELVTVVQTVLCTAAHRKRSSRPSTSTSGPAPTGEIGPAGTASASMSIMS